MKKIYPHSSSFILHFLFPASVNSIPDRTPPDVVSVLTRPKTGASLDSQTFDSD